MSGGVDSSVAAILLKEQGYEVIGVTMKLLDDEVEGVCCNLASTCDAKRVCDFLDIPHYTLNFKEEFKTHVIDDFVDSYKNCRTPNPCIECNKYLKFGAMYKKALELDCEYIATGHYAKIEYDKKYNMLVLKKANASKKDQSYVLYNTPKELLPHLLFPLANFKEKEEIRAIAKKYSLPVANKPDSEDICFIPDGDYAKYLEENSFIKPTVGNIVDKNGKIFGKHAGMYKYTIGQRRGLKVSYKKPLYVTGFNKTKNEVIVGEDQELYMKEFMVQDVNFLVLDKLESPMHVSVKTRYSTKSNAAVIYPIDDEIKVVFDTPQRAITPGQSAVFYDGDIVLGGGKIK